MLSMSGTSKVGSHILRGVAWLRLWKPAVLLLDAQRIVDAESGQAAPSPSNLQQAQRYLEAAMSRAPSWASPHFVMAQVAALLKQQDEQEHHLWMALQCKPDFEQAEAELMKLRAWRHEPVMRGWHLYYSAQPAQAVKAFHEAQKLLGKRVATDADAEIHAGLGWSWHAQQAWDRGAQCFEAAVQADSALAHAWKGLGLCHYHMHQLKEAESAFDRSLQLNAQAVDVVALLGWCAYAADDFDTALRRFEAAIQQNPLLGDAWWGVAWCQWRKRDSQAAGKAWRKARQWAPDHPSAAKAAAIFQQDPAYGEFLDLPNAVASLHESAEGGGSPILWDAMQALHEGNLEQAGALLNDDSMGQFPTWQVELLRSRVERARNQPEAAIHHLQAARAAAPHRADAAHELSRYLDQLNREEEAGELLEQYPNHLRSA